MYLALLDSLQNSIGSKWISYFELTVAPLITLITHPPFLGFEYVATPSLHLSPLLKYSILTSKNAEVQSSVILLFCNRNLYVELLVLKKIL